MKKHHHSTGNKIKNPHKKILTKRAKTDKTLYKATNKINTANSDAHSITSIVRSDNENDAHQIFLIDAIRAGNLSKVKTHLPKVDINLTEEGKTLLKIAVTECPHDKLLGILEDLIAKGTKVTLDIVTSFIPENDDTD